MELIHAANAIEPAMFGEPVLRKNDPRPGDYCEEYEHAWVMFPADDPATVRVSARTDHGSKVLTKAEAMRHSCADCNADAGEVCRPYCTAAAAYDDENGEQK